MKKQLKTLLSLLIMATLAGGLFASGQKDSAKKEKKILLRLAEAQVDTYPATLGAIEFARLVNERSEGRIQIEVYTGGQLGGDEKAVLEQVQFGAIDFTRVNISPATELAPMLNLLQLPYLYESYEHMHKVLDSPIGAEFLASVEGAKLVGLALYDAGSRNFYNNKKPITSIEEMAGLKLRVPPSQLMMGMVNALGASATPMAFGEVYSALQTGVIDGAENNWASYDMVSHYEVANYITEDAHTMPPEILVASKMVMDKLAPEDVALIKKAALDSVIYERSKYKAIEDASKEKLLKKGIVISELKDREKFIKAVEPLYAEYTKGYTDVLKQIIEMK